MAGLKLMTLLMPGCGIMTGAELRTLRGALGLNIQNLADIRQVRRRTVEYWESGKNKVPVDVAVFLNDLDIRLERAAVEWFTQVFSDPPENKKILLLRYREDADLWRFQPDFKPLPVTTHAVLLYRLRSKLEKQGIETAIHYLDVADYLQWLVGQGQEDSSAQRATWAALALVQ